MPPIRNAYYLGWRRYLRLCLANARLVLWTVMWRTETRSAEIGFGMMALGWWIVLSISPAFEARNLYDYLGQIAGQEVWAWIMGGLGSCQFAISWLPQSRARFARAGIWVWSAAVWSYIAWVSMLAVPVTTAAAAYSVLAIGSVWAFLRSLERT